MLARDSSGFDRNWNDFDIVDNAPLACDINKGNRQIAHGIDRVLRPINL